MINREVFTETSGTARVHGYKNLYGTPASSFQQNSTLQSYIFAKSNPSTYVTWGFIPQLPTNDIVEQLETGYMYWKKTSRVERKHF